MYIYTDPKTGIKKYLHSVPTSNKTSTLWFFTKEEKDAVDLFLILFLWHHFKNQRECHRPFSAQKKKGSPNLIIPPELASSHDSNGLLFI